MCLKVHAYRCVLEEYAGGFDGYPSSKVGDGHEKDLDTAVQQMLPGNRAKQNAFMKALVQQANPVNLSYPKDIKKADGGTRMANIGKLNSVCRRLITVNRNC